MYAEIITLCHSAIEQNGNLSILAAFNNINVAELPHKFPPFTLVCRLRFDPSEAGDHQLKVTVADKDTRVLGQMMLAFTLFKHAFNPAASLSVVFPISGMELRHAGEHTIELVLDARQTVRTPFYVIKN